MKTSREFQERLARLGKSAQAPVEPKAAKAVETQAERTMADLYVDATPRTYKLRRYSRRGLMAQGAEVRASSDDEAIAKARALFSEPEYRHDRFEIEGVE